MNDVRRLEPGMESPDFVLPNQDGIMRSVKDFKDRGLILYFFPAAASPGCSKEAADFNDNLDAIKAAGYEVMGASPDKTGKLKHFHEVQELGFDLVSDKGMAAHMAFGAFGEKTVFGHTYRGVLRSTMIISNKGVVEHALYNVKATGHVANMMDLIGAIRTGD